jgi:hypothetical protein
MKTHTKLGRAPSSRPRRCWTSRSRSWNTRARSRIPTRRSGTGQAIRRGSRGSEFCCRPGSWRSPTSTTR